MNPGAVSALQGQLRGQLLRPSDEGYDAARTIWNGMIDRRPALIARCVGVGDVVACVNVAREHRLPLSVKGGGHNIAGLALCNDGLVIDLSPMRGVWVDPVARVARAQGGCLLGDLDRETQLHGLAAVLGFVSNTGIAGLTLGGGFGYLTRRYGWASDNVLSMEVVTADGRVVRASEQEHPDLFWGLRGGSGNFGVVTSFEYRLYPVGPEIFGGVIAWAAHDAEAVLEVFQRVLRDSPPEFSCVPMMRNAPPAPWLPVAVHGTPIVALFVCYAGPVSDGERLMAP
ncbi:MAG: FAD-binding oxidoreductase, partial [Vicinamibacterales bacterium]